MNKAILVGIDDDSIRDFDKALVECERLLEADNLELKAVITQKSRKMDPNTALRSGKLEELKEMAKDDVDVIVFLNNLNEGILNKLMAQIDCPIIDRTALILDIFSSRARSKEAMIQIEMARLKYNMSNRILDSGDNGHSRGGAFMNRGAGESKSDIIILAVSAARFGRNPLEFSLNFASHIGSMTCKIHCCTIRSTIVGIPRGLVFPLGFGISTRLTGRGW